MTKLLLAGATGLVGMEALKLLLADVRVDQVVAPRSALPPHAKLLNPITTIAELTRDADWWKVDGGISALGTTRAKTPSDAEYRAIDHDYPLAVATLVRERGAISFAPTSSMGANARSRFAYTRTKGELDDAVDRLGFPSFTIARPGFIGGSPREHRSMKQAINALLRIAAPILPASARTNPASTIKARLVDAEFDGAVGKRIIAAAEMTRTAEGRR